MQLGPVTRTGGRVAAHLSLRAEERLRLASAERGGARGATARRVLAGTHVTTCPIAGSCRTGVIEDRDAMLWLLLCCDEAASRRAAAELFRGVTA